MTIIDKPNKVDTRLKFKTPSLESFEETYKTAYTHGLEAIYSLENVDLKTVRKIKESAPENEENDQEKNLVESSDRSIHQQEFDFGEDYREWIEPFFLYEPIQVLGLSFQAEARLREHGMKKVSDLLAHNFKDYVFLKGMGQGHIDEVQKKLEKYIDGRSPKRAITIDFKSLLLSLSTGISFKKLSLFLKDYQLADIVPLTPAEKIELKAFDFSKGEGWRGEVLEIFNEENRHIEAIKYLQKIGRVFILPWMQARSGVATQDEITERLERVSEQPNKMHLYFDFFMLHFTSGKFPLSSFLLQPEREVYCCNERVYMAYQEIIKKALSYFYKSAVSYSFDELIVLLGREFAKDWKEYSQELLGLSLKRSSFFQVLRGKSGKLEIRLA